LKKKEDEKGSRVEIEKGIKNQNHPSNYKTPKIARSLKSNLNHFYKLESIAFFNAVRRKMQFFCILKICII